MLKSELLPGLSLTRLDVKPAGFVPGVPCTVICTLLAALCTLLAPSVTAQARHDRTVTLVEALELFRDNNLNLAVGRSRALEAESFVRQARAYPNPTAVATHEPLSADGASYSETYLNLSQRIELPGVRRARIEAADWRAQSVVANVEADSLTLLLRVARNFVDAVAQQEAASVLVSTVEVFRSAVRSAAAMAEVGEGSGYDLRRIRVEGARYENRLADARLAADAAQRRLSALVLPASDTTRLVAETPTRFDFGDPSLEDRLQSATTRRAEIRSARADVAAESAGLRFARSERIPEPTVTGGYKRQSDGFQGAFLGVSLPIPVFNRNQGAVLAQTERLHQAETTLILVERAVSDEVRQKFATYASLADRYAVLTGDLVGEADTLLNSARVAYAEGELSVVELLDAAEAWLDSQITAIEIRRDLQFAYYDLLRASGDFTPVN